MIFTQGRLIMEDNGPQNLDNRVREISKTGYNLNKWKLIQMTKSNTRKHSPDFKAKDQLNSREIYQDVVLRYSILSEFLP